MQVYPDIISLIGNTPIVKVNRLDTGPCELYIKLEGQNPGGSIKDRIALKMIEAAEKSGQLKPGDTIVEATAGNTGLGLAMIAAVKGYRMMIVLPDKMSQEKISHLKAYGAEIVMTRSDVSRGHPEYYQDLAESLIAKMDNAFYVNQFANEVNPQTHEEWTGPEIWQQMGKELDTIVVGAGTAGTITGVSRYFAKVAPHVEFILADPEGSILTDLINDKKVVQKSASWMVEGIGEDFVPVTSDFSHVSRAYPVNDKQSFHAARELLSKEGIFVGSSTGTLIHAALQYCREQTDKKRVLIVSGDSGNKYLSKMFNDTWMQEKDLL